jgi:type III restriction enzyme
MKLLDTFNALEDSGIIKDNLDSDIQQNLAFKLRPYQVEAIKRFDYYISEYKNRIFPSHLFYHMATGSGKTLIMAANIIQLYKLGYRNFVFLVNLTNILEKTKDNFINLSPQNKKYLFKHPVIINGTAVQIKEVNDFNYSSSEDINIIFLTTQGLQSKMQNPTEYGISEEDFANRKVAIIWDESHHGNVNTRKNDEQLSIFGNWEITVKNLLELRNDNILLEFTATMELDNQYIENKYRSKYIFDYSLKQFRTDRYSKEIKTNQTTNEPIDRILGSILISLFKQKVFAKNNIIVKPVILAKSKTIKESSDNKIQFIEKIDSLSEKDIIYFRNQNNPLLKSVFVFFDSVGLENSHLVQQIKIEFSYEKIVSVDSQNDSEEKQISLNSLENENNPIRLIFAVDKLNEGWDVLNLFDIVRLYDTRDARSNVPGKTTTKEAQLIGRGARYYPFKYEEDEFDKRKFDNDLDNQLRVCETLHYHCSYNPKYIDELTTALKEIGIIEENRKEVHLKLKQSFKESELYKNGFLFANKKISSSDSDLYSEPDFKKIFELEINENFGFESNLFEEEKTKKKLVKKAIKRVKVSEIHKSILLKALSSNSFFNFDRITKYFPKISSIDDFFNKKYLGSSEIIFKGPELIINNINEKDLFEASKSFFKKISDEIYQNFGEFQGSKIFFRHSFKNIFKDKTILAKEGRLIPEEELDIKSLDWYVYEENFGTSEEKYLVRFFNDISERIMSKYKVFYLVRNERFFKIHRFSDGKAFEPDYVLFLNNKSKENTTALQIFVEPKGEPYLNMDEWKEKFLISINDKNVAFNHKGFDVKIIGLPFYNESLMKNSFYKSLCDAINI